MSTYQKYDPKKFVLRRQTAAASTLDEFLIGESVLGSLGSGWTTIPAATVSFTSGYTPDANGTLIVDSETVSIAVSYWGDPDTTLYPGNRIEVRYAGKLLCRAVIDTAAVKYSTDPEAAKHGKSHRVDLTATGAGTYAVMMNRQIAWTKLPKEKWIDRIRRWCTVNGWDPRSIDPMV